MRRRHRRTGFTLIELLIVVVIIGILAAMAIPKFQATKGKANFAAIKSDLKNLSTAQESYFYENRRYHTDLDTLKVRPSNGVIITITLDGAGWQATAYHPSSYPRTCALFYGTNNPIAPATTEGVIACN
jgi:prepilin-type N-terminal cleavage/methylation domain-containing protein